jgi:tetratricopeptide (TPR) repeat protein
VAVAAFHEDRVMFGVNIPGDINACLQKAVAAYDNSETAESLLWQAQHLDPNQLEVYVALYKFYFYKNRIDEAEGVVFVALKKSAELGNFCADWKQLTTASTDWFSIENPQRLYLYALKALSFIRLRQSNLEGAESILRKLRELDPTDQVGGSVLQQLASAMRDDD